MDSKTKAQLAEEAKEWAEKITPNTIHNSTREAQNKSNPTIDGETCSSIF